MSWKVQQLIKAAETNLSDGFEDQKIKQILEILKQIETEMNQSSFQEPPGTRHGGT